jgi:nucleoside-diphosphate-sugar epimerase
MAGGGVVIALLWAGTATAFNCCAPRSVERPTGLGQLKGNRWEGIVLAGGGRPRAGFARLCEGHKHDGGSSDPDKSVLVLGAGWVGSRVAQALLDDGSSVVVTHRPGTDASLKPPYFRPIPLELPRQSQLQFDVEDTSTWEQLPPPESLSAAVLTFPMADGTEAFWESYLSRVPYVICYSTTSIYQIDRPGQEVDESTPTRQTPRSSAEEYCRERGACVLTISGIFGERRSPRGICTCLSSYTSSGGALNGNKKVNMVHVDDIVAASTTLLKKPVRSTRLNVAGHNFLLDELISHCKHPPVPSLPDTDLSSKRVSSQKLLDEVMPTGYDFVQPLEPAVKGSLAG